MVMLAKSVATGVLGLVSSGTRANWGALTSRGISNKSPDDGQAQRLKAHLEGLMTGGILGKKGLHGLTYETYFTMAVMNGNAEMLRSLLSIARERAVKGMCLVPTKSAIPGNPPQNFMQLARECGNPVIEKILREELKNQ